MGWQDEHLHQFTIHGKHFGLTQPGGLYFSDDPHQVRLGDFHLRLKERFRYEYDLIDRWQHQLRLEKYSRLTQLKPIHSVWLFLARLLLKRRQWWP